MKLCYRKSIQEALNQAGGYGSRIIAGIPSNGIVGRNTTRPGWRNRISSMNNRTKKGGHMLKLIRYINERGGFAVVPKLEQPIITLPIVTTGI